MLKTGVSGAGASMLDMGALVVLVERCAVPVGLAAFASAGVGALVGFLVTKFWAFRDSSPIGPRQVAAYGLVTLSTATIVAVLVHRLAQTMPYPVAKLIAGGATFALWSYPAQRGLVFAGSGARGAMEQVCEPGPFADTGEAGPGDEGGDYAY